MKFSIHKKFVALFSALVIVLSLAFAVVGFPTTAKTVSAEGVETVAEDVVFPNDNDDKYYKFADGASVMLSPLSISFLFQQKNTYFENRMNWTGEWSKLNFTIFKQNGDETNSSARYDILIFSKRENIWGKIRTHVYFCAYQLDYDEGIDFSQVDVYPKQLADEDITYSSDYKNAKNFYLSGYTEYRVLYEGTRWTATQGDEEPHCHPFEFSRNNAIPYMRISFPVSGAMTSYFMQAKYELSLNDKVEDDSGELTSADRSIYDVVKAIDDAGGIETQFKTPEEQELAREIIREVETPNKIKVNYLQDLDGTYFSEMVSAEVAVPVVGGSLSIDDVTAALGVDKLKAQNSYVKSFVCNEAQTEWTAQYNSSVCLKMRTVDGGGHVSNMFLDLNESYGSYFKKLVGAITNGQGLYENMWNSFIEKYDILYGKNPDTIHGFFGLIWLPSRNELTSFNEAAKSIFNIKNEELGFIRAVRGEQAITLADHNALMTSYNYNWMASLWDETADFVTGQQTTAQYYFFAAEPREYVGISQTGNAGENDDDGALEEVVRDPLGSMGDLLGDFFGLGEGVGGVAKRVSSLLIVLAVGFGIVYVIAYFRGGGGKLGDLFKFSGKKGKKK